MKKWYKRKERKNGGENENMYKQRKLASNNENSIWYPGSRWWWCQKEWRQWYWGCQGCPCPVSDQVAHSPDPESPGIRSNGPRGGIELGTKTSQSSIVNQQFADHWGCACQWCSVSIFSTFRSAQLKRRWILKYSWVRIANFAQNGELSVGLVSGELC